MNKSINVLLTTIGRQELPRMLNSLVNQLQAQDFLTVVTDRNPDFVHATISNYNWACPVTHIINPIPLGYWGHGSRNKYQNSLPGDYIMNGDDDDRYADGAFDIIRNAIGENKLYLFKHKAVINGNESFAWFHKEVREGNIGTSCGVIPNTRDLPEWLPRYGGDGAFYEQLAARKEVVWCDHIIYKVGDAP